MFAEDNNDPEAMERHWREALEAFEKLEGISSATDIEGRDREIRFVHCHTHNNYYPSVGSDADNRIKAKIFELKTSSLNSALLEFESTMGESATVKLRPCCAEIEQAVEKLRKLVTAMKLDGLTDAEYRSNINRHAAGAFRASMVPKAMIPVLLGTGSYKSQAAQLSSAMSLDQK